MLVGIPADVAHRYPGLFGDLLRPGDQLLAPFFRQRRYLQSEQFSICLWSDPEIRSKDPLLYVCDGTDIEGLDDNLVRLRHGDVGQLFQGCLCAVVIDSYRLDQTGVCPACTHASHLLPEMIKRLGHAFFGIDDDFLHLEPPRYDVAGC